jgi:N-acetyl-gamma-glutamyl-phosphate reductase
MELLRLLLKHPVFELAAATSRQEQGKTIKDIFPQLQDQAAADLEITPPDPERLGDTCRLVFLAVPHGTAMDMAAKLLDRGLTVIDFSADFRLRSAEVYERWYSTRHVQQHLLSEAIYGLSELNAEAIKQARLVANPGCYPTSILLGLYPAVSMELISSSSLIIDSKSGTSGAGRAAKLDMLFCEVYDSFKAYSLGRHRHTPEIEQELAGYAGGEVTVTFSPHLVPINRGILSTMYAHLSPEADPQSIREAYVQFAGEHSWIRIMPPGRLPQVKMVRGTMFCDIGLVVDERTGRLIVVSAIDNLCRGASGQALANANLACGLHASTGLDLSPLVP